MEVMPKLLILSKILCLPHNIAGKELEGDIGNGLTFEQISADKLTQLRGQNRWNATKGYLVTVLRLWVLDPSEIGRRWNDGVNSIYIPRSID